MIYMNFNSYASLVVFFIIPAWLYSIFEHETIHAIRVLSMFDFYYRKKAHNLTESENLLNSDCPFRFLFEDFLLCSRFFNNSITALGTFPKLCLVLQLLLAGSLFPRFHFQLGKKSQREVWEMVGHSKHWQIT